jgi:hypothetical protein
VSDLLLEQQQWLSVIEHDYLSEFIRKGGAAVKVAVTSQTQLGSLTPALIEVGQRDGYVAVMAGGMADRVHLIDKMFHQIAKQIDWQLLARGFMRQVMTQAGYALPDGDLRAGAVAAANNLDAAQVRFNAMQLLNAKVLKDAGMVRNFRVAMSLLCNSEVDDDDITRERADEARGWLTGDLVRVTGLTQHLIFQKVNRHNARAMLGSTANWLRLVGKAGLVVVADVSGYSAAKPEPTPDKPKPRAATKAAVSDAYEMMRQFIDATDELSGVLLIFLAGPEFITDDNRGMRVYPALETRLVDDVRDRRRANPLAPMVRIATDARVAIQ